MRRVGRARNTKPQNSIVIYTDGGCDGNPGPGAWAAVILTEDETFINEIYGYEPNPKNTSSRMEIMATVKGLEYLKDPSDVVIKTDSQFVARCITGEYGRHRNLDLWDAFDEAAANHEVTAVWIRGHRGNFWNERAHTLAECTLRGQPPPPRGERQWG